MVTYTRPSTSSTGTALDITPAVPEVALRETALLLAAMAPPVELIEAATGRSASSPLPVLR